MAFFHFNQYPTFSDGVIDVAVEKTVPGHRLRGLVPVYRFKVMLHGKVEKIGQVDLRIGYSEKLVLYGGHIGYGIDEAYRGHGYAAMGCILIKQVAIDHHMDVLWITCNPENIASARTCEKLRCTFVETIALPPTNDQYWRGERFKRRYRWIIYDNKT